MTKDKTNPSPRSQTKILCNPNTLRGATGNPMHDGSPRADDSVGNSGCIGFISARTCLLLLWLLAFACAAGAVEVVIGAEDDWPPYSSVDYPGAPPAGYAVNIVREAFATQGFSVRLVALPFARCMFLAKTGQVSGCFNATVVEDNRDDYNWHPTPMFHEELAVFALAGQQTRSVGLRELEGKTVGYTLGYTYPAEFRANNRIRKFSARSDEALLLMLLAHRVDYILINTGPAYLRIRAIGRSPTDFAKVGILSNDGFWVAFTRARPDGAELAAVFEQGLGAMRASGRLAAMESDFRKRLLAPATGSRP